MKDKKNADGISEADMATRMMDYLEGWGWDCYPEADLPYFGGRADIAAVRRGVLWIIETKLSFTLALLDQALARRQGAHIVSIAVPRYKNRNAAWPIRQSSAAALFCRQNGIGVFSVDTGWREHADIYEDLRPRWTDRRLFSIVKQNMEYLHPDMKRYAPGAVGKYGWSTPWRRTMNKAQEFIAANPGCTIKELVESIDHHYSNNASARGSLLHWLEVKKVCRMDRSGHAVKLFPLEAAA